MTTMVRGGRKADGFYATDTQNRVATPIHPMYQDNIFSTAHFATIAQLAEHAICNRAVIGSIPIRGSLM